MSGIKAKRKQLVRKTLMRAKAQGERAAEQRQELPEEYAQTEVQQGISDVAARTGNTAKSTTRISYRKFRAMQEKRKNLTLQGSTQSASKPTEKEKVTVPTQTERREMFKKKRFRQKAIAAKTPAPQAPVPSSATPAPPPYQAQIQDTFWAMHEITYEVEEVDTTPEPTEDDPDPEQQTDYILHITVSSKTVDELAELYNFTQDQKDILHQLLSEEMRPSLLALCGGIAVADGELCWPLPGHTYISCHFGEVDAFGNAGHRGTDIPAPEGTPILAAHSGTVLVSGWNDSYGNQVLLDNGAGLSTRYAHMTQTAVTAGEAVTAGQIIGYVGSTGDSTGNHLHFEVMQNGVRMNPLELVFAQ